MLGLTLWAIILFQKGHDVLGGMLFMLSLGFKQMALYYAPAVYVRRVRAVLNPKLIRRLRRFAYLLGKCFWLGGREGCVAGSFSRASHHAD